MFDCPEQNHTSPERTFRITTSSALGDDTVNVIASLLYPIEGSDAENFPASFALTVTFAKDFPESVCDRETDISAPGIESKPHTCTGLPACSTMPSEKTPGRRAAGAASAQVVPAKIKTAATQPWLRVLNKFTVY